MAVYLVMVLLLSVSSLCREANIHVKQSANFE
jgi:hypothetical protein